MAEQLTDDPTFNALYEDLTRETSWAEIVEIPEVAAPEHAPGWIKFMVEAPDEYQGRSLTRAQKFDLSDNFGRVQRH
jgi:hypothetical protein